MSTIFESFEKIKPRVRGLLTDYPHLRDNDRKLIATYWKFEAKRMGIKLSTISGMELLKVISDGNLTLSGSILRVRQKLQEDNPSLRGDSYTERKDAGETMRTRIHEL